MIDVCALASVASLSCRSFLGFAPSVPDRLEARHALAFSLYLFLLDPCCLAFYVPFFGLVLGLSRPVALIALGPYVVLVVGFVAAGGPVLRLPVATRPWVRVSILFCFWIGCGCFLSWVISFAFWGYLGYRRFFVFGFLH